MKNYLVKWWINGVFTPGSEQIVKASGFDDAIERITAVMPWETLERVTSMEVIVQQTAAQNELQDLARQSKEFVEKFAGEMQNLFGKLKDQWTELTKK